MDSSVGLLDILSLKVISIFEPKSIWVELGCGETETTSGGAVSAGPPGGIPSLAQCVENRIKRTETMPTDFFDSIDSVHRSLVSLKQEITSSPRMLLHAFQLFLQLRIIRIQL